VMSYCGSLDFGIVADREQMRDVWKLIDWLGDELDGLLPEGYQRAERNGRATDAPSSAKSSPAAT